MNLEKSYLKKLIKKHKVTEKELGYKNRAGVSYALKERREWIGPKLIILLLEKKGIDPIKLLENLTNPNNKESK